MKPCPTCEKLKSELEWLRQRDWWRAEVKARELLRHKLDAHEHQPAAHLQPKEMQ